MSHNVSPARCWDAAMHACTHARTRSCITHRLYGITPHWADLLMQLVSVTLTFVNMYQLNLSEPNPLALAWNTNGTTQRLDKNVWPVIQLSKTASPNWRYIIPVARKKLRQHLHSWSMNATDWYSQHTINLHLSNFVYISFQYRSLSRTASTTQSFDDIPFPYRCLCVTRPFPSRCPHTLLK